VTRDPDPTGPFSGPEPDEPPPSRGRITTTSAGAVIGFGLFGLVAGWALRPLSIRVNDTAPTVGWLPVLALAFVALVVGSVAWSTYRALQRRHERLEPHKAVNRLVLAKSCALAGALVAGGYLGYALSWVGLNEELAGQRIVRSLIGGAAGVALVVGSLLLERACRVSGDDR
jgi:uncharacterized membrane protein (Fun14 family)